MAKKLSAAAKRLTLKQRKFCKLYMTSKDFFGNGTQSYIEAYNPKKTKNWIQNAGRSAADNLKKPHILAYLEELYNLEEMNPAQADKELAFCMKQHADLGVKLRSVDSYNKLKKRITDKIEHKITFSLLKELDGRSGVESVEGVATEVIQPGVAVEQPLLDNK